MLTATGATTLIAMQAPASLAALTSDPPEDITLLRIRGQFRVDLSAAAAAAEWNLALIVQDTTWTPSSTFTADADKRMLWSRTFAVNAENTGFSWLCPGYLVAGTTTFVNQLGACDLDISPKVKLEPGKALFLACYEEVSGRTLTTTTTNMRVLFQRSGRR